jgi:hypothetical protein
MFARRPQVKSVKPSYSTKSPDFELQNRRSIVQLCVTLKMGNKLGKCIGIGVLVFTIFPSKIPICMYLKNYLPANNICLVKNIPCNFLYNIGLYCNTLKLPGIPKTPN